MIGKKYGKTMTTEEAARRMGARIDAASGHIELSGVTLDAEEATEGDLCFAKEGVSAQRALERGASAVVTAQIDVAVPGPERALLRVADVGSAALRFAGSLVDESQTAIEYLGPRELTYLKMIMRRPKMLPILPARWEEAFERVMARKNPLLVTGERVLYDALRPGKAPFAERVRGYVVSADTLFRTTFRIEAYIYQYKPFPHFHLDALRRAIALAQKYELPWTLDRIGYTRHFRPVFTEGEPSVQEAMQSAKVVILSDNLEDILTAREYASDVGHWMAKTLVMVPKGMKVEGVKYPAEYSSTEEIADLAVSLHYNYLFILTADTPVEQMIRERFAAGQRGAPL